MIALELLKQVREITGAGLSQCKAALEEAGGDRELAIKAILAQQRESQKQESDRRNSRKEAQHDSKIQIPASWSALGLKELILRLDTDKPASDVLSAIKKHGSTNQRRALALSSSTTPQIIQQLSVDHDVNVAFAAKVGRKLPADIYTLTIKELAKRLPKLELEPSLLDRISRFPSLELQKAIIGNQHVTTKTLEFLRSTNALDVRNLAFEKLLDRGENPISDLDVCGTGCDLEIFEISEDQYRQILKTGDIELLDDPAWDLVDQSQYNLPDDAICNIYVDGSPVGLVHIDGSGKPCDEVGKRIVTMTKVSVTEIGKRYAIRAWENKGTWYGCKFRGRFDESKLSVAVIDVKFGAGESSHSFEFFDVKYRDALPDDYDCSTRGKSVSLYLVNDVGTVTEL